MSVKKLLLWALTHTSDVRIIEKRKPYESGTDITLTSAYESDKEKRHHKMPEDYVLLVIPR